MTTARLALVVSLVIWAVALAATQFVGGKQSELAFLIAIYTVPGILASAGACLVLGIFAKRKAQ